MSEYGTTEIQTMLKSALKGVWNSDSSDFRLLELHLNGLKSKLTTPTVIQQLNAIINAFQVDMGVGIQKIAFKCCLMLCYYPF